MFCKKRAQWLWLGIVGGCILGVIGAQAQPKNEGNLQFYFSAAGFKNLSASQKTYEEFYVSFAKNQISSIPKGEKFIGGYELSFQVFDRKDNLVAQKATQGILAMDSLAEGGQEMVVDLVALSLSPGEYTVKSTLKDLNTQKENEVESRVVVPDFEGKKVQISDLQFSRRIRQTAEQNKFVKNHIEVIPYPSLLFGIESPFVYVYSELYNLKTEGGDYTKTVTILNQNNHKVQEDVKPFRSKSRNSVWVEKINILKLRTGRYVLRLSIADNQSGTSAVRESTFWIHNPRVMPTAENVSDEELQLFRAQIFYLVDRDELKMYDALNKEGKVAYMNRFWQDKPLDFREEHLRRFYLVQQRYSTPTVPGWKTDRGRVYIMYGPPDEIETEPASLDTRAHEVWIYESLKQQNKVIFVFADLGIYSNYQLVHCTLRSGERVEIYNPNWREEIKIAK